MNRKLIFIFLLALILRFSTVFIAYHGDLNNNISWGELSQERGLSGFYENPPAGGWPYSAPNQPPLSILMFTGISKVWQIIEDVSWFLNNNFKLFYSKFIWFWESQGMTLLVKTPPILADIGIGWIIYHYIIHNFADNKKKEKLALILSAAWLFNPVTWYNSSVWGQTDSIVNLLGLAAILFLLRKKLVPFAILFTLSFLFKGSLTIFIPILFFLAVKQGHKLKEWARAGFGVASTVFLVSIWFHPKPDIFAWLFNLYKNRILPGEIGYLTANAFNLWWLVDPGRVLDSTVYLGLPARTLGYLIALVGIGVIIYWLNKKITDKKVFFSLSLTALLTFLFMTRIHERYLYPFFPYATLLIGVVPFLFIPYGVLSITHLLNLYHLFWAPAAPLLEEAYTNPAFPQAIAIINILVFIYLLRHFRTIKI